MIDDLQAIVRGEFRIRCMRTFGKRMLHEMSCAVDKRPEVTLGVLGLGSVLAIARRAGGAAAGGVSASPREGVCL
ncbi:MAG: hypothetical protein AMXMBFR34_35940 [Myxococcaceae bacterium]